MAYGVISALNIAVDTIAGAVFQRLKLVFGTEGVATEVTTTTPLPVALPAGLALWPATQPVSGTVTATWASALPVTDTALGAKLDTLHADLSGSAGAALPGGTNMIGHVGGVEYETIGPSVTNQVMGVGSGNAGDYFSHLLIQPTATNVGTVIIKDGANVIYTYPGGTVSASLYPIDVPLGMKANTNWNVTTGTGLTAVAFGDFTPDA
jgi:hypothetical protein